MATLDFVIHFRGRPPEDAGRMTKESDVFPATLCPRYTTGAARAGRQLVLLGEFTKSHDDPAISDGMMDRMREPLRQQGNTRGKIMIYGSSSGGRQALALAGKLSQNNIALEYVGIMDAAFFPQDTLSTPPDTPRFFVQPHVSAETEENYFQTAGNGSEWGIRAGRRIYSSSMKNKEIHGDIAGFDPKDLTKDCVGAEDLHAALILRARPLVQKKIAELLDGLVGA